MFEENRPGVTYILGQGSEVFRIYLDASKQNSSDEFNVFIYKAFLNPKPLEVQDHIVKLFEQLNENAANTTF